MDQVWLGEKKDAVPTCLAPPSLSHLQPLHSPTSLQTPPPEAFPQARAGVGAAVPAPVNSTSSLDVLPTPSQDQALRGKDEARAQLSEPSLKQGHSRCSEEVSEEENEPGG